MHGSVRPLPISLRGVVFNLDQAQLYLLLHFARKIMQTNRCEWFNYNKARLNFNVKIWYFPCLGTVSRDKLPTDPLSYRVERSKIKISPFMYAVNFKSCKKIAWRWYLAVTFRKRSRLQYRPMRKYRRPLKLQHEALIIPSRSKGSTDNPSFDTVLRHYSHCGLLWNHNYETENFWKVSLLEKAVSRSYFGVSRKSVNYFHCYDTDTWTLWCNMPIFLNKSANWFNSLYRRYTRGHVSMT
jgi:hypothetical protein